MPMNKTYHELITISAFTDRFEYLKLTGIVGRETFGFNRFLNQQFYTSSKWRSIRSQVIIRDDGCDLAHHDYPISGRIHIHHINPVTFEMLENEDSSLYNLDNLVCVSEDVHRAIHYGDVTLLQQDYTPRYPGDTKLW